MRRLQDASLGWENRELFSGPWSIVMYNECLILIYMYTHTHAAAQRRYPDCGRFGEVTGSVRDTKGREFILL